MKTKIRKSLATILALVMVLSMVSFASAQVFPDIPESLDSAATRLAGLGIIAGYPDGTFRPDNNITRGEFAKIAVIVLGLEKSADLLENVPSNFKDVKVGDWYNKYVNVAANQGILKGYPDGTFKPNSNITQAEALTIVLRLLGYKEDHLPGNWPYNYVTQADRIGLLDAGFDTGLAASRGWVADLVSRALEVETVTVVDGEFQKGESLIKKSFGGQIIAEKRVVATLAASTGDTITVADDDGKETTLNVAANAVINGAAFNALRNHMVDLTTKVVSGKEYVVTIDVLSTKLTGEVTKVNNLSRVVTISGTEVTFSESVPLPQPTDNISVYIYKGRVYYAEAAEAENAGVITDIILGAAPAIVFDYDALNPKAVAPGAVITLNGAKAALTDLAANQYAVYELNDDGQITKLDAYSNVVIGKLEAWEMENNQITSITVNGVEYAAVKGLTLNAEIGVTVMLSLNHQNLVYSVIPLSTYASTVIGEFQSLSSKTSTEGQVYYIVLKDGTSYDITEAVRAAVKDKKETLFVDLDSKYVFTDLNVKDSTVKICYNAKGEVVAVYVFSPQTVFERPAAGWDVSGDFDFDSDGNPIPIGNGIPDVLEGKFAQGTTTYSKDGVPSATLVVDNEVDEDSDVEVVLRYVITWDAESGIAKHIDAITEMHTGTVTGIGSDYRGKYVTIIDDDSGDDDSETGDKYYFSEATESFYGTLNVGDKVEFTFKPAEDMWTGFGWGTINKLNYLKVTKYAEHGEEPEEPTRRVTYIVTDYTAAFGRLALEDVDTNKSTRTIDSFDAVFFNDVEVSKTVMKAWFAGKFKNEAKAEVVVEITEDNVLVVKETPKTEDIYLGDDTVAVFSQTELTKALDDNNVEVIELYGEFKGFHVSRNVTIKGGTIVEGAGKGGLYGNDNPGIYIDQDATVVIDGVTFDGDIARGIVTVSGKIVDLTVKNCTFDEMTTGIYLNPGATGTIEGNTFKNLDVGIAYKADAGVTTKNNTFINVGENIGTY